MTNSLELPIAVFGATGAQGAPVARALLAARRPVRVIVRDPAKARPLADQGAEVAVADLTDTSALTTALTGVSGAFIHLPSVPDMEFIQSAARSVATALVAARVPVSVYTSSGAVASRATKLPLFDTRNEAKDRLLTSGASIIFFEPVSYLGNLCSPFAAPPIVRADELRYPPFPASHRQPWVSVEDQARLALLALDRPDLAGRTFGVGEQLTGLELALGLSNALGKTITCNPFSPATLAQTLVPMLGERLATALEHDYRLMEKREPAINLDVDTARITTELGTQYTDVATWAGSQPWDAMAEAGVFLFPDLK
jgi:NAD(P)H dehydrogenase (quinone)